MSSSLAQSSALAAGSRSGGAVAGNSFEGSDGGGKAPGKSGNVFSACIQEFQNLHETDTGDFRRKALSCLNRLQEELQPALNKPAADPPAFPPPPADASASRRAGALRSVAAPPKTSEGQTGLREPEPAKPRSAKESSSEQEPLEKGRLAARRLAAQRGAAQRTATQRAAALQALLEEAKEFLICSEIYPVPPPGGPSSASVGFRAGEETDRARAAAVEELREQFLSRLRKIRRQAAAVM